jgi:stress response protein SCP2
MLGCQTGKGSNQKPETRVALLPVPAQGERKNIIFLVSMYSFQCFTMHEIILRL